MYSGYSNNFNHNVNLILSETNHHYYYQQYKGPKIGYNVWESTEYSPQFFNQLLKLDELWVPTEWQKEISINQKNLSSNWGVFYISKISLEGSSNNSFTLTRKLTDSLPSIILWS